MPAPNAPPVLAIPFANSGSRNVIPVPPQTGANDGAASWTDGFPARTMLPIPPGIPPDGKDMNGAMFAISAHAVWAQAGGRYYWSADVAAAGGYPLGAILNSAVTPTLCFKNTSSGNTNDPDSVTTGWQSFDNISGLIRTAAEISAGVTPVNYAYPPGDIRRYGAAVDDSADDSAAWASAVLVAASSGAIYMPRGTSKVVTGFTIAGSYVNIVGEGAGVSTIRYAPTGAGTLITFADGADMATGNAIRGIRLYSSDSTYAKVALNTSDQDHFSLNDVIIGGSVNVGGTNFWSGGAASTGIRTNGRDQTYMRGLNVFADKPIVVAKNPNSTLDADHFHFEDCYLGANGNPIVTAETGVNLTNFLMDGYQAWVLGTSGFYWVDTTGAVNGYNVRFENIRAEQGSDATAYLFNIQHNTGVQELTFRNFFNDNTRRGFKLRNCSAVVFDTVFHNSTREAMDVDSTVGGITISGCIWHPSATATLTGQNLIWRMPFRDGGSVLPPSGYYDSTVNNALQGFVLGGAISQSVVTVANNGVVQIDQAAAGRLVILTDEGYSAEFALKGALQATAEVSDPDGKFSVTASNAGTTNVYWHAGSSTYQIQNSTGAERKYKYMLIGSYVAL